MGIIVKLYYEELIINIQAFSQSFEQNHDVTGRPSSKPTGGLFDITFETTKNDPFLEYMLNETKISYLKIHIQPAVLGSRSRTIELRDVYVMNHRDHFNGINDAPMTTYIKISPGSMVVNGQTMFVKYWAEADPNAPVVAPTIIEEDNEPQVVDYYLTDFNGNKTNELRIGDKLFLIVKTKNLIGELLSINLDNKNVDFIYKNEILTNDTISDYTINKNTEKIELEVTYQGA